MFGDRFRVSPETYRVLDLIWALWDDPHIDQVPDTGCIEFAWHFRQSRGGDIIAARKAYQNNGFDLRSQSRLIAHGTAGVKFAKAVATL